MVDHHLIESVNDIEQWQYVGNVLKVCWHLAYREESSGEEHHGECDKVSDHCSGLDALANGSDEHSQRDEEEWAKNQKGQYQDGECDVRAEKIRTYSRH